MIVGWFLSSNNDWLAHLIEIPIHLSELSESDCLWLRILADLSCPQAASMSRPRGTRMGAEIAILLHRVATGPPRRLFQECCLSYRARGVPTPLGQCGAWIVDRP